VFARARENARRASCQSNLKQIGLGVLQYVQDYDEKYPIAWYSATYPTGFQDVVQTTAGTPGAFFQFCTTSTCGGGSQANWLSWMDITFPYTKSVQIFKCPSSTDTETTPDYILSGAFSGVARSYYGATGGTTSLAEVERAAEVAMLWDTSRTEALYVMNGWASSIPRWADDHTMHLEGMNIAYGDGHVKWSSIKNVQAQTSGSTSTSACSLASPTAIPNCSRMFNPFRP
jgi:prepilin-type processing-associated H-X9-DG protein